MPPRRGQLVVKGYRPFMQAIARADRQSKRYVRETFREVGDVVRRDAAARFQRYDGRTAAGLKTRVRQRGIAVEQSLRKTTGLRPDWGALQMTRALLPAGEANDAETVRRFEHALDLVADHFDDPPR